MVQKALHVSTYPTWVEEILQLAYLKCTKMYFRLSTMVGEKICDLLFSNGSKCTSFNLHTAIGSKWPSDYPPWLEKNLKVAYLKWFKMYFRLSNMVGENIATCIPELVQNVPQIIQRSYSM